MKEPSNYSTDYPRRFHRRHRRCSRCRRSRPAILGRWKRPQRRRFQPCRSSFPGKRSERRACLEAVERSATLLRGNRTALRLTLSVVVPQVVWLARQCSRRSLVAELGAAITAAEAAENRRRHLVARTVSPSRNLALQRAFTPAARNGHEQVHGQRDHQRRCIQPEQEPVVAAQADEQERKGSVALTSDGRASGLSDAAARRPGNRRWPWTLSRLSSSASTGWSCQRFRVQSTWNGSGGEHRTPSLPNR